MSRIAFVPWGVRAVEAPGKQKGKHMVMSGVDENPKVQKNETGVEEGEEEDDQNAGRRGCGRFGSKGTTGSGKGSIQ
jgi:hypothetical protein